MATIKRYQTAEGERWEVRYRQPTGITSRKRGFTTKRDASTWAAKAETSKAEGSFVAPARGRVTVADLSAGWLARQEQSLSPSYYRTVSLAYGKHVAPKWGGVPVGKVDSLDVKAWAAAMTRAGSSATVVNRAVGILAGILDDAVEHRALAFNPARRFKRGEKPKKAPKRHVYLTEDDVCRLAEESGRHADLVLVLAFTGLRWGEAIALTLADVEFLEASYFRAPQRCPGRATVRGRADQGQGEPDGAGRGVGPVSAGGAMRGARGRRSAVSGTPRRLSEASKL